MTVEHKEYIDTASYLDLITKWKFAHLSENPLFQGDTGEYYHRIMMNKKSKLTATQLLRVNNLVGK